MTIGDYKIKSEDFNNRDIMGLPDKPSETGVSAATLKERFDAAVKYIVAPKLNALIEELVGEKGAANTGVEKIEGVSGYTVQEVLEELNAGKLSVAEAGALVKTIAFEETSGVLTITRYDGSVQTIDTALEKIALDVRLDGQELVLTLIDGTEQRADLSAFLTQTETKNSDTITLGEEAGVLVARLVLASVTKAHLAADVAAYLEAKESGAASSAQEAMEQASEALRQAEAAAIAAKAAAECQTNACQCATNAAASEAAAGEKASSASQSAANAAQAAEKAKDAAKGAQQISDPDGLLAKHEMQLDDLAVDLETYEKEVTELRQLLQTITDLYALKTEVGNLTELATNAKENLVAAINELKQAASDAGYFYGDDGTKYRWGKDDIGIYCEDVIDPNAPIDVVLELGEGGDTGYYAEIEGQTKAIENAVGSVEKLTEGKIFFEILEEGEARE